MSQTMWFLVFLTFSLLPFSAKAVLPTVATSCNTYAGVDNHNGITQWLGIRFAAPPIGSLRFVPPQDPTCTTGVQSATQVRIIGRIKVDTCSPPIAWEDLPCHRRQPHGKHHIRGLPVPGYLRAVQCHGAVETTRLFLHPRWRIQRSYKCQL
jgi:hypothetical protein